MNLCIICNNILYIESYTKTCDECVYYIGYQLVCPVASHIRELTEHGIICHINVGLLCLSRCESKPTLFYILKTSDKVYKRVDKRVYIKLIKYEH